MTSKCARCCQKYSNNIMYLDVDGKNVCIHCLGAEENATKFKTQHEINEGILKMINQALKYVEYAKQPRIKIAQNQPLECVENYREVVKIKDEWLDSIEYELKKVIA